MNELKKKTGGEQNSEGLQAFKGHDLCPNYSGKPLDGSGRVVRWSDWSFLDNLNSAWDRYRCGQNGAQTPGSDSVGLGRQKASGRCKIPHVMPFITATWMVLLLVYFNLSEVTQPLKNGFIKVSGSNGSLCTTPPPPQILSLFNSRSKLNIRMIIQSKQNRLCHR